MPGLRVIVVALGVGLGAAAYTILWWHWALVAGGIIGIVLGGLALVGSVSIGPKADDADAAWRAAAPEFVDSPAVPREIGPAASGPGPEPKPEPTPGTESGHPGDRPAAE